MSTLLAGGATLIATVLTVLITARCTRTPRLDLVAWAIAAAGVTLALAAQALGYKGGFGGTTFRAIQLGAQLMGPVGLVWGLAELVGKGLGARFAARLALGALTVIGAVVLATDPLNTNVAFATTWPAASVYYAPIPHYLLDLLAVVTAFWAVAATIAVWARGRDDSGWQSLLLPALAVLGAVISLLALRATLPAQSGYPLLCLIAVVLAWYAARRASAVPLAELRGRSDFGRDPGWDDRRRGGHGDDPGYGHLYRSGGGRYQDRRADTGGFREVGEDTGGYGFYRADTGSLAMDTGSFAVDTGSFAFDTGAFDTNADYGRHRAEAGGYDQYYRDDPGMGRDDRMRGQDDPRGRGDQAAPMAGRGDPGIVETGDMMPMLGGMLPPGAATGAGVDTAQLYGQIAIYTLIEGYAEEFDQLAKDVVDQVRDREPNTLVYVLHGVPSAPMQRILYEVYRDTAAYEEHLRRPYVEHFEEQRRPFVLATNVIELGVRQAKVAPLQEHPDPRRGGDFWSSGQR